MSSVWLFMKVGFYSFIKQGHVLCVKWQCIVYSYIERWNVMAMKFRHLRISGMKDCDYSLHYKSFKFMQVDLIVLCFLTRVIEFLSHTRSYFVCFPHNFFLIYYLHGSYSDSLVLKEEGVRGVWMYRTSLEHSRYLILLALLLHSFTKTVIHHSQIQLYVSVPFLLAPIMWCGCLQPDTKLMCPIGIIVVLSDFGQVHITLSRKWHTVAQELKEAPAGQLSLWGRYYSQSQHSCSSFYVFKSCKECCDGLLVSYVPNKSQWDV